METTTLIYLALAGAGGLGYWFYFWAASGEGFIFRKAVKSWLAAVAAVGAAFALAPSAGPVTILSGLGAISLGVNAEKGVDFAKDLLTVKSPLKP